MRPVYTVTTLMEVLPLSRNKLYQLLESGKLVGTQVGSKWLIHEQAVEAFLGLETDETPGTETEGIVTVLKTVSTADTEVGYGTQ